jgi:hypothetical protein
VNQDLLGAGGPTTVALEPSPAPDFVPRLPVLRRPPGWRSLDEPALRSRVTQIYLSLLPQPPLDANPADAGPAAAGVLQPGRPAPPAVRVGEVQPLKKAGSQQIGPRQVETGVRLEQAPPVVESPAQARRFSGSGLGGQGPGVRLHIGWLLAMLLLLVGLLAAMLFATLEVKKLNPAAVVNAVRAAQQDRSDGRGGRDGVPELPPPAPDPVEASTEARPDRGPAHGPEPGVSATERRGPP